MATAAITGAVFLHDFTSTTGIIASSNISISSLSSDSFGNYIRVTPADNNLSSLTATIEGTNPRDLSNSYLMGRWVNTNSNRSYDFYIGFLDAVGNEKRYTVFTTSSAAERAVLLTFDLSQTGDIVDDPGFDSTQVSSLVWYVKKNGGGLDSSSRMYALSTIEKLTITGGSIGDRLNNANVESELSILGAHSNDGLEQPRSLDDFLSYQHSLSIGDGVPNSTWYLPRSGGLISREDKPFENAAGTSLHYGQIQLASTKKRLEFNLADSQVIENPQTYTRQVFVNNSAGIITWENPVFSECQSIDFGSGILNRANIRNTAGVITGSGNLPSSTISSNKVSGTGAVLQLTSNSCDISGTEIEITNGADYHLELAESVDSITLNNLTFTGAASINKVHVLATSGTVTITINSTSNLTTAEVASEGATVEVSAPQPSFAAANIADGTRLFLAHEQTFIVAAADINTADNDITLGNDSNGDAAVFASSSPYTTVHINLASGATMPTTSPQLIDGGRYYATLSSGDIQLFSNESNIPSAPITFSDQGTDSGGSVVSVVAETELYNAVVSGGSGVSEALSLSSGASILRKAIYWSNSGTSTATPLYIQRFNWNATTGASDPQSVNPSTEVDTIHNRIISLTNLELDGEIKNASGVGVTSVTPTNDGSSLSSVYGLVLEGGGGKLQVNSNDSDGIAIWQDLYAWGVFVTSTESGIRLVNADTFTAVNLRTFDLKNLQFDNISSTPLAIVGGIARTIDGSSLLAQPQTGSGGIAFNALALGTGATVETGVSGLTSGEAATLAKLDDLTELDGVIYRFTANALEQAPSGGGGGDATAANQTSIINTLASIQGPGFIEATDSLEAIRDRGDASWITATGFSTHSAADVRAEIDANSTQLAAILANTGTDIPVSISALNNLSQADIRTAVGLSSANLDAQLGDIPTMSEFNARTLASADYFDPDADTVANVATTGTVSGNVGGVVGVTFPASFNNLSSADVQTAATASLNAYNPPTRAELTSDINSILTQGNSAWATADVSGLSTFNPVSDQVIVATNNDKTGYSLTQAFPSNFSSLAIDGSGQVTAGNMRGTDGALTSFSGLPNVTVGGYAAGQAPNDLIDISTIQSNVGLILGHTRPMAKQLGLVSGVTATHTPTAITVSDGDGSTTITDNGSDSYTVQGA